MCHFFIIITIIKYSNYQGIFDELLNYGNCERDFTYIDDIVEGIVRVIQKAPNGNNNEESRGEVLYSIYNIGHGKPVNLYWLKECFEL